MSTIKVAIIGTGHVGLVTSVTLAAMGHGVTGTDSDPEKIEMLERGKSPFYEPRMQELLREGLQSGRLRFTLDSGEAIRGAEMIFICVGTPRGVSGEASCLAIEEAARGSRPACHDESGGRREVDGPCGDGGTPQADSALRTAGPAVSR